MLSRFSAVLLALLLVACAQTNTGGSDALVTGATPRSNAEAKVEIPQCSQPLGTLALVERQISALEALDLPSPLPMLNTMVSQSGCFQIVDQNAAAFARGKHKAVTPDYLLSADILAQNPSSGGFTAGGIGGFLPGMAGTIASSVSVKTSEVQTALYLSDTKTGLQVTSVTGHAQTSDVGMSFTRFARTDVSIGAYADTPIGKTTTTAFIDAYIKLVNHVKASPKRTKR